MRSVRGIRFVIALIVLGSCSWSQPRFDAGGTANNPFERTIGRTNVTALQRSWTVPAPTVGSYWNLLAKGNRVFASASGTVDAFDASTGRPLWSAPGHGSATRVVLGSATAIASRPGGSDLVLVGELAPGSPLDPKSVGWTTALDSSTGAVIWSIPEGGAGGVLLDGTLFARAYRSVGDASDFSGTIALDAATGTERFRIAGFRPRAAADGMVYGDYADGIAALPSAGCGLPRCTPTWTAHSSYSLFYGSVAVGNGSLYLAGIQGLEVFPAGGCGSSTCTAAWKAAGSYGAIAVTADRLFLNNDLFYGSGPNVLHVFDARGCGQATCSQLWGSAVSRDYQMPIVANGLVYLSARGAPTEAWSTDGCGSATCPPLWSTTDAPSVPVTPIVINGRLLLAGTGITTYALP